jgi:L-alanine-DL-glutamate epimerase-like enolase superfamily enzyme
MKNFNFLELQWGEVDWRGSLLKPVERFEVGSIAVPDGPGFGITLNEELAREKRLI